jgi:hypothetical protein
MPQLKVCKLNRRGVDRHTAVGCGPKLKRGLDEILGPYLQNKIGVRRVQRYSDGREGSC